MFIRSERGQAKKAAWVEILFLWGAYRLRSLLGLPQKDDMNDRFRQSLFKSGNPGRSIHLGMILFSRTCDLICRLNASK